MSWKLSILSIALFGMLDLTWAARGQDFLKDVAPQNHDPAVTADDTRLLAALSKADKELIEKQKTCPVTDQKLGAMGQPVKVVVKGRTVFLCCTGCKKKFAANTDKYLKKLDEQKRAADNK